MKRLFLIFLLFASAASAAPTTTVDARFAEGVSLREVARIALEDVLHRSYVFSSEFLSDPTEVAISLRGLSDGNIRGLVLQLLDDHGYRWRDRGGVVFIERVGERDADREHFYYRPRYRSVSYLTDLIRPLFPEAALSSSDGARLVSDESSGLMREAQRKSDKNSVVQSVDTDKDAMLFVGSPLDVARLKALLPQLDSPRGEVYVRAEIWEVSADKSEGSALSVAVDVLSSGASLGVSLGSALSGDYVKLSSPDVNAVFSVLSSDGRFKSISSPSLRVLDGETASLVSGAEIPILGSVTHEDGQAVQSIDYRSTGVKLEVQPSVRGEVVELSISQEISSLGASTGVSGSPVILTRSLSSSVSVSPGELVLLGGLRSRSEAGAKSGPSFLPRFLRGDSSESRHTDVLIALYVATPSAAVDAPAPRTDSGRPAARDLKSLDDQDLWHQLDSF